jgi:DNA-binding NtrC family response regulator
MNSMTKRRVLLVEDDKVVSDMAQAALEDADYEVRSASQISEAMALVRDHPFEAAVLDVKLGKELVFGLAATLIERHIPFLFAAGPSVDVVPSEFADHAILRKPYRLRQLTQMLDHLLESQGGPPAGAGNTPLPAET